MKKAPGKPTNVEAQENPLFNIAFNIVLPVVVLNQGSKIAGDRGPLIALGIALAIPILYGFFDYLKRRKHNWMSALGLVNVAVTGGLVLLKLDGIWFAVKEAFFPFLLGSGVLISGIIHEPFVKKLFWNSNFMNLDRVTDALNARGSLPIFERLLDQMNLWFSGSFFVSSALNFWLARRIFTPIDGALGSLAVETELNSQIAKMTWQGYLVIALPMMAFMLLMTWYLFKRIREITGLTLEEILPDEHKAN